MHLMCFLFLFFYCLVFSFDFRLSLDFDWCSRCCGCSSSRSLCKRANSKETSDQCGKQFVHEKYSIYFSCEPNTALNLHVQRGAFTV